jgi:hypothetical protein
MDFKLHAPYQPTGDQPEAIRQLVEGIQKGYTDQVLLGATGTGKSLGYEDPVFVVEKHGDWQIPRVLPIGELVDRLFDQESDAARLEGDSQVLDVTAGPLTFLTQAFNPQTSQVDLYPVQSFLRHATPEKMYQVRTSCGRNATLTGDHNLWVLRKGDLQLINTAEARPDDYVPLPEKLIISPVGVPGKEQPARVELLLDVEFSTELVRLLGYYIAEANYHPNKILFVTPDEVLRRDLEACLDRYGVSYTLQPKSNL